MPVSGRVESLEQHIDMEQTERDLVEQAAWLNTREDYIVWEQRCDEFIESLYEHSRIKIRDYQSVTDNRWSHISRDLKVLKIRYVDLFDDACGRRIQRGI